MSLLDDRLGAAVARGDPPAAALSVRRPGEVLHESAHGADAGGHSIGLDAWFDLASVTKVAATTLSAAVLVARGHLDLDRPVAAYRPSFGRAGKGRVTVRELLGHRSGLPAWAPLFERAHRHPVAGRMLTERADAPVAAFRRGWELVLSGVDEAELSAVGRRRYSDFGFLALGAALEVAAAQGLDELFRSAVVEPLGLDGLTFGRLGRGRSSLAGATVLPTGTTRPRPPAPGQRGRFVVPEQAHRPDPGEVDDDNAYACGGVAGHAGLFGRAAALARLGVAVLEELEGACRLGAGDPLRAFVQPDPAVDPGGAARGLGFDRDTSGLGPRFGRGPRGAVGHFGFTGTSLWLDLDRGLVVALLTNRTFPGRDRVEAIRALRAEIHDAAVDRAEAG
ncbi:MAG: serine hydrolase domain-containing protein [Sandaracinaceae bacterium]